MLDWDTYIKRLYRGMVCRMSILAHFQSIRHAANMAKCQPKRAIGKP